MTEQHTLSVKSSDGTHLHVVETGNPEGPPMLFIHGWSQCHLSWMYQLNSDLARDYRLIAFDLRGHGNSGIPTQTEAYNQGGLWADDIDAIITSLELDRPLLAGWSYGGLIICDYIKKYGEGRIRAVNFCSAAVHIGPEEKKFGEDFVASLEAILGEDLLLRIDGVRKFISNFSAEPLSREDAERAIAYNMMVPTHVKKGLLLRTENFDDTLRSLSIPVLVSQGDKDTIVLPAMSQHTASITPGARLSLYEGVGHAPFIENTERFNMELRDALQVSK